MLKKLQKGDIIPLSYDKLFKKVLKDNKEFTAMIVSNALKDIIDCTYEDVMNATFVDVELAEENYQEKHQIVDVVLRLNDKTQIVLEMNRRFQNWLYNRNLSYIYSINNKENRVGKTYSADNVVILINFDVFKSQNGWPKLVNIFVKKELTVDYTYPYENAIMVHIPIEYSNNILYTKNVNKDFIKCLKLIGAETKEEMELISKDNKVLKEVLTSMKEYSSNDEMAIYYDTELQAEMIRNSEIEEATNNGLKLGEERGRLDEKLEIAKTMLQDNMSLEQIAKFTGLSLEELKKLTYSKQ